ncbi:MAG: hypothetical protein QM493_11455 [Sulfurovum sp.]
MKTVLLILLTPILIFAKTHYAKVEPYQSVIIKSSVSALVMNVNLEAEGKMIDNERVIYLDDSLDKVNLDFSNDSVKLLKEMLVINKDIAKSLAGTVKRQKSYYRRINRLSTASKTQKDNAYNSFTSAKTQHLSILEKIISLEKQILDIRYKIAQLEDSIAKKSIILNNQYLSEIVVRRGDFVGMGSPLAKVFDMSQGKLVLFLEASEAENIESKEIYIDDKKSKYKVDKIWLITDERFISSYKAEIYIDAPKGLFSKLVKVEIR